MPNRSLLLVSEVEADRQWFHKPESRVSEKSTFAVEADRQRSADPEFAVQYFQSVSEARNWIASESHTIDIAAISFGVPETRGGTGCGAEFIKALRGDAKYRETPIIAIDDVLGSMHWQIVDEFPKLALLKRPLSWPDIANTVASLLRVRDPKSVFWKLTEDSMLVGMSRPWLETLGTLADYIDGDARVIFIGGESGVGKNLLATAFHKYRCGENDPTKPLVPCNSPGLGEKTAMSELFGHKKGSFTGAIDMHIGHFGAANKGVVFFDEIAHLPGIVQPELLVLFNKMKYHRVGTTEDLSFDGAVVCATNEDLDLLVAEGKFLETLRRRIQKYQVIIPPLRERKDDIPKLIDCFVNRLVEEKKSRGISKEACEYISHRDLPGNVRQLEDVIKDAAFHFGPNQVILADHFLITALPFRNNGVEGSSHVDTVREEFLPTNAKADRKVANLAKQVEQISVALRDNEDVDSWIKLAKILNTTVVSLRDWRRKSRRFDWTVDKWRKSGGMPFDNKEAD
jgi:DNA-binding NtrC family response regulator